VSDIFASNLDDGETIAEYLTAAAEDENPDALLLALTNVAKERGMAQVAPRQGAPRRHGPIPSDS
jgi:probable addiction module antidote protein